MRNFVCGLVIYVSASSLYSATWMRTFDAGGSVVGRAVVNTRDSCYLAAGGGVLLKVDKDGVFLWSKTFGGTNDDYVYSMDTTFDGGYILTGSTYSDSSYRDVWLVKVNAEGDTVWTKTFISSTKDDCGYDVRQTVDSGYVITGFSYDNNADVLLIKTDVNGDSLWAKKFGGTGQDYGYGVCEASDSGYIVVGSLSSKDCLWILRTDKNGDTLWTKKLKSGYANEGKCIQRTIDGNYIITGQIGYYACLVKIDENGDTNWVKKFQNYSEGTYVDIDKDNGYIMVELDAQILKTDGAGVFNWDNKLINGQDGNTYSYCVRRTPDNGYIIAGQTYSYGGMALWLMRMDPGTGIEEKSPPPWRGVATFQIFPNPFVSCTQLSVVSGQWSVKDKTKIYDISGKLVEETKNNTLGENLKAGIYFVKVGNSKPVKIVKMSYLK